MLQQLLTESSSTRRFGRVHHGFLNDIHRLGALNSHANKYPAYLEVAEGDVCWYQYQGKPLLVMLHPNNFNQIPPLEEILLRLERGEISTLADTIAAAPNLAFVVELKTGSGPLKDAMLAVIACLESEAAGRYIIDGFATEQLKTVKQINPTSPVSLHTRLGVWGNYAVRSSFQFPYTGPIATDNDFFDCVTVTYSYSPANFFKHFGASIDSVHKSLLASGKHLILGGIDSDALFAKAESSCAIAAYHKYNKEVFSQPYEVTK